MDGLQLWHLQFYNTWANIKCISTKQITLNREDIIHGLNYGNITSRFPAKIFCNFPLGEIIKHYQTFWQPWQWDPLGESIFEVS